MQKELFQPQQTFHPKWYIFKNLEIGKLYEAIPWQALSECLPRLEGSGKGAPRWLTNQGMFGMMFLKHYLNCSDKKLIERFNTDWSLQFFCQKVLKDDEQIRDMNLPSRIRSYMATHMDLDQVQAVLLNHWKTDIENPHALFMDATCYESYIRFPTDIKLLWECNQWVYEKLLFKLCKLTATKRPRNKYLDQKRKQLTYDRLRRKSYRKGTARKRSLLYLLHKGLGQLQTFLNEQPGIRLTDQQYGYIKIIQQVYQQQQHLFTTPGAKVTDRIVSLHKPYLRPIVRGKENKPVEFGMKAHMLQVGGITYFDTMSFKAFNECKRLKLSTLKHRQLFGELHQLGADRIYATNENRRYSTAHRLFTNFARKGPVVKRKNEQLLKAQLNKVRSTHLEGSFGNHKNHYGLKKIKAKGKNNERVWAFFGVMAANALAMAHKQHAPPDRIAA